MLTLSSIFKSLVIVTVSLFILQILRKKGKVKHEILSGIGLILSLSAIVRIVGYISRGNLDLTSILINLTIFVAGLLILIIWGLSRKSKGTRSV